VSTRPHLVQRSALARPALFLTSSVQCSSSVLLVFLTLEVRPYFLTLRTVSPHQDQTVVASLVRYGQTFFLWSFSSRLLQVAEKLMSALLFVLDLHFQLNIFINAFHLRSLCVATLVFLPWSVRSQILFVCSNQRHHRMSRMRLYASTQICRCTFK
jgi:hypothetical protein